MPAKPAREPWWINAARALLQRTIKHLSRFPRRDRPALLAAMLNDPTHTEWENVAGAYHTTPQTFSVVLKEARAMNDDRPLNLPPP